MLSAQKIKNKVFRYLSKFWNVLVRGKRIPILAGLLSIYFTFLFFTSGSPSVRAMRDRLDRVVYDQRYNVSIPAISASEDKIVIVDIDEASLASEGQWPWSRFKLGNLVHKLSDYGVIVVGFDVFFPEHERNLVTELKNRIEDNPDYLDTSADFVSTLDEYNSLLDGDRYFADSFQSTDVVLGIFFLNSEVSVKGSLPEPIFKISQTDSEAISLVSMQGYTGNVDVLQKSARGGGFFDTTTDLDGVVRKTPLIRQYKNSMYPSLSMDMARLYLFEEEFNAEISSDPLNTYRELTGIYVGDTLIPTDNKGQVNVPYLGPSGSFPYISAADILNGEITPEQEELLFNSLVLVGTTATGLYDLRATPVQEVYPGVEVHANVLNGILNASSSLMIEENTAQASEDVGASFSGALTVLEKARMNPFPIRPDWEGGAIITAIIIVGLGLSFIYPYLGPALLGLSSLTFMLGLIVLNFQLWARYNLDISLVPLLFLIALITAANMTYGFLKEGLSKKAIKGMFDQYVPPAHIDAMLDDPDNYNFDGESKELSVLFSDIRSFTSISEKLSAVELKTMLNDYFTPITGVIFDNQGTIDKYVGDMVMAFWGAPLDDADHRNHSVTAALKMLEVTEALKPAFVERGLPEINIGVGINSGMMNVGDMGSTYRRSYTVLGDAVNLGSRLESITKVYGVKLLIGEETYKGLVGFLCRQIDKVQVKGKEEPIRIYQPLCREEEASDELIAEIDAYNRAYANYLKQEWDVCEEQFQALAKIQPELKLYQLYLERIASLRDQQLPEDWDGTFRHTEK